MIRTLLMDHTLLRAVPSIQLSQSLHRLHSKQFLTQLSSTWDLILGFRHLLLSCLHTRCVRSAAALTCHLPDTEVHVTPFHQKQQTNDSHWVPHSFWALGVAAALVHRTFQRRYTEGISHSQKKTPVCMAQIPTTLQTVVTQTLHVHFGLWASLFLSLKSPQFPSCSRSQDN